jgi:hypothetical protein
MQAFQSSSLSKLIFVIFLRFFSLFAKLFYYESLLSSPFANAFDYSVA